MKKYFQIVLFIIPILIFVFGINWYVDSYGALRITYDDIADHMVTSKQNVTYLSESKANDRYLLLAVYKKMKNAPETAVIGSSRVMNFEEGMFDGSFYNAGLSEATIYDLLAATGVMVYNNKLPKRMIIGVDSFLFNPSLNNDRWKDLEAYEKYMESLFSSEGDALNSTLDANPKSNMPFDGIFAKKQAVNTGFNLSKTLSLDYFRYNIDLFFEGERFRAEYTDSWDNEVQTEHYDGSLSYESGHRDASVKDVITLTNAAIDEHVVYRMPGCEEADKESMILLSNLIKYLVREGVEVSVYLPPYSPMMYDYIESDPAYIIIDEIELEVRNMVAELDSAQEKEMIKIYGSYSPYACGLEMSDMYDIYHIKAEAMMKTFY